MGITRKKHYNSYTLAFKVKTVKESNKQGVKTIDVTEAPGNHPVMLYRWRQEIKEQHMMIQEQTIHPPEQLKYSNIRGSIRRMAS